MVNKHFAMLFCAAAAFGLRARAAPLALVEDGKSAYSIVISSAASPSERRGAQELRKFPEEISGARLPVASDSETVSGPLLLVGNSKALERLNLKIPFSSLGPEGFALRT